VEHGELKQEQQAINAERKRIEALPDGPDKENDSARLKDQTWQGCGCAAAGTAEFRLAAGCEGKLVPGSERPYF
ncbi:MAG: hypothetical protein WBX20_13480, partial [Terrimicrobiaceae bacterium]